MTRPALLAPAAAPLLRDSSPHVIDLPAFEGLFGHGPRRSAILEALRSWLLRLSSAGVAPICLLVGGSFVRAEDEPNDLDGLLVYRLVDRDAARALSVLQERVPGLDLRIVPGDADPILLLRMSCFFHTLYQSRNLSGGEASFLIRFEGPR